MPGPAWMKGRRKSHRLSRLHDDKQIFERRNVKAVES
jgi:hypothetical protein